MLLNYLKISVRYLVRNGTFSAINLFGLTLGFFSFLVLAMYVHDELSFDTFHADADRIYRVIQHEQQRDGTVRDMASVAIRVGPAAASEFPEIEMATRFSAYGRVAVGNDLESRDYLRLTPADTNFFRMFNFPLKEGDPATALKEPMSIVVTESAAIKYFGEGSPLGKTLWTDFDRNGQQVYFYVTGVMKDNLSNSHLRLNVLVSEATFRSVFDWYADYEATNWEGNNDVTYLKLRAGADVASLETKITEMVKSHYPADREFRSTFTLQPLKDIHMHSDNMQVRSEISTVGIKPFYIYLFAMVGGLILLIACLNYLNLSTAAAYKRTREIGTRKTLGAQRTQLIAQFAGEAVILSVVSFVLAFGALPMLLPIINQFTEKQMSLQSLPSSWILGLTAVMLVAGIGSSVYPAFIIARVSPSEALKKNIRLGRQSLPVRKLLVATQFAISILMIAATLVIYNQLNYLRSKDLGFTLDGLFVIDINGPGLRDVDKVKEEFFSIPEVQSITTSGRVPGEWKTFPIATVKNFGEPEGNEMIYVGVDKDFLSTYNIKLLEGRNFAGDRSDSTKVIITRLAAEQLGLDEPVGQEIEIPSSRFGAGVEVFEQPLRVQIIGVADNFHFESFRQSMMPLVFAYPETEVQGLDYYTLRVETDNWSATVEKILAIYRKFDSMRPMEYNFLEDRFMDFYRVDEKRGQLFLMFSGIIVLIACLGLFALVSYSVESRVKEISIRKTLGASVGSILVIIGKEFVVIVLVSAVVALPVAWYLVDSWLNDFAYRVPLGPGVFVVAALLAAIIATVTVVVRTVGTARANPVKWLRSE